MAQGTMDSGNPRRKVVPSPRERELLTAASAETGDNGAAEALQIGSGRAVRDLKIEALESDHERSERFRNHFENAIICMMWVSVAGFMGLAAVWALNICLPANARWLAEDKLHDLQGVLTGGLLIGLVGDHVKRRMQGTGPSSG